MENQQALYSWCFWRGGGSHTYFIRGQWLLIRVGEFISIFPPNHTRLLCLLIEKIQMGEESSGMNTIPELSFLCKCTHVPLTVTARHGILLQALRCICLYNKYADKVVLEHNFARSTMSQTGNFNCLITLLSAPTIAYGSVCVSIGNLAYSDPFIIS